ncbi:gametogenetin-binding protein 2 isoform X1 [Amblyraja radiata]|uniref:gametogenetin-binding protein 2 isoform X1 n=1 Tax=Amblyraja radiata TaxID=386614 RepID=UPI001403D3B7|nr:gametogenetin-binding protein 2 isoform X1 [Amblyraja radiata]
MARLVAVCRDGEEEFPFEKRQIPLYIDDTLTMVMEFSDNMLNLDGHQINGAQLKQFVQQHGMLKQQDLNIAMMVTSREVFSALSQLVPCVGCRRSVERLFSQLVESGNPALEPLSVGPTGVLSVTRVCMTDAKKLYTLFYVHGSKLNETIDAIPKSKKNKRCQLHSLDTHKPKPLGGCWMDVWELMSQECRDEVVLIDSSCLLETLETYLRKHRFCTDCKNKVLRAYNILIGELDCSKEKGYCAALYEGLRCCPHERHIHVCCETDFIAHLLGRAEPEFAGGYERRERHAKTIDIAQEEVLTCLGIHLYERLHRIWQKLRAEEQTWQMLFYLGIDALRKSFEMAIEKVQGISRLEQLCEELSEEERVRELKQEKKRQKRKNRRKNKCACEISTLQSPADTKAQEETVSESIESSCKDCGSTEDPNGRVEVIVTNESTSCTCPGSENLLGSPKTKKGLSPHCNGSDCGYSSSMEGSETGSREGSDVACTEGICNHDEPGDDTCVHHCVEDKEEDGVDSCVECWANVAEENTKGKNKKKKKKGKGVKCAGENAGECNINLSAQENLGNAFHNEFHHDKTKDRCNSLEKGGQQPVWVTQILSEKRFSQSSQIPLPQSMPDWGRGTKTLKELLEESECTSEEEIFITQDEIQAFMTNNQSFYINREQYRQHLKERFNKYCRSNDYSICNGWLTTAGVN